MTPETKIPVYRREIAPGIGFTTFSAEGTTLLGWIVDSCVPSVNGGTHGICCDIDVFYLTDNRVLSPDAALAYARAGMKGLKFEPVGSEAAKKELGYIEDDMPKRIRVIELTQFLYLNVDIAGNATPALQVEHESVKQELPKVIDGTGTAAPWGAPTSLGPIADKFISKKFAETAAEYLKSATEPDPQGGYPIPREIAEPFIAAIDAGQKVFFGKPFTFPEGYRDHLVKPDEPTEEPKPETWRDRKPLL